MGYVALFVFYVMVLVLTVDMSRYLLQPRGYDESDGAPAPRPMAHPVVHAYARTLRARRTA